MTTSYGPWYSLKRIEQVGLMLEAKRENVHVHALDMDLKCQPPRSIYDLRDNGKTYIFVGYELSQKDEGGSFWV